MKYVLQFLAVVICSSFYLDHFEEFFFQTFQRIVFWFHVLLISVFAPCPYDFLERKSSGFVFSVHSPHNCYYLNGHVYFASLSYLFKAF